MATYSGTIFPTVAIGSDATVAIKPDATIEAWGSGGLVPAPSLSGVATLAAYGDYGLAIHSDGTVTFIGTEPGGTGLATLPSGLTDIVQGACARYHAAVTHADGTVTAWGYNADGQTDVPAGLSDVKMVVAGNDFTMALMNDGTLQAWGDLPAPTPSLTNVEYIDCYGTLIVALLDDGTVEAWGANSIGQADVPAGLASVTGIAAGGAHGLAVKDDGTVEVWPTAYFSVPSGLPSSIRVEAAAEAMLAMQTDGSIEMWANDGTRGEVQVPTAFEAMLPGDAPAATDFLDATIPFSAEFEGLVGPIGDIDATIPFGASFSGFIDWESFLEPIEVQEIYTLTITGAADSLDDLVVKISNWQATNQAGTRSSYVQAVIPAASDVLEGIEARQNGELVISKGYRLSDGTTKTSEILRSNFDTFRYDRGARRFTVTVSGFLRGKVEQNATRTLTGIRSLNITNGKRRARCNIDMFLQPGMTVEALDETFKADYINYYVAENDKFCEVSER